MLAFSGRFSRKCARTEIELAVSASYIVKVFDMRSRF